MPSSPASTFAFGPTIVRVWARDVLVLALAGLTVGGLTSFGQQVLPDGVAPLANSATPWVAAVGVVLALRAPPLPRAAVLGAIGLVAVNCGYGIVSTARGHFYDPTSWNVIGAIVGPLVGTAVVLLGSPSWRLAGAAAGALAAIPLGEGLFGLLVVGRTEYTTYWVAQCVLAVLLLVLRLRRRSWPERLMTAGPLVLVAGGLLLAYVLYSGVLAGGF